MSEKDLFLEYVPVIATALLSNQQAMDSIDFTDNFSDTVIVLAEELANKAKARLQNPPRKP